MFVGAVIVDHEMEIHADRRAGIDDIEKPDKLLVPVAGHAIADHVAVEHAQGREQRGGAVALVIMRHGPAAALLDRQPRLCAIQRLNLALFVYAEDDRLLRRIQIQTHHIGHLFQKLRIARELKSFRAMRLQVVSTPDIVDRGLADALTLRHSPATPMRHPRRFGLQGRVHDIGDLLDLIGGLSSAPRSDVPQTIQTLVTEAFSPRNHSVSIH